jgi:hypothetical protein
VGNETGVTTTGRRARAVLRFIGVARAGIGTLFMVAPEGSARRLVSDPNSTTQALTFGRMAAGRDLALGLGTLYSSWTNADSELEWLLAGVLADTIDFYAFLRDDSLGLLPRIGSALVAASAVGLGAWTFANLDPLKRTPSEEDSRD